MDRALFEHGLDKLLVALRAEAVRLFDAGVPAENCHEIALSILNAKARAEMVRQQRFAVSSPALRRQ